MRSLPTFTATTEHGYAIGRTFDVPTINLDVRAVPRTLEHGVYACKASLDGEPPLPATMHFGPRPVFDQPASCEIHILDTKGVPHPQEVEVTPVAYLRPVMNFPSKEALVAQILLDNEKARGILGIS